MIKLEPLHGEVMNHCQIAPANQKDLVSIAQSILTHVISTHGKDLAACKTEREVGTRVYQYVYNALDFKEAEVNHFLESHSIKQDDDVEEVYKGLTWGVITRVKDLWSSHQL